MRITINVALAVLVACMPLAAFADSVDFGDSGGTITASGGNTLTLNSTLSMVSGLGIYNCSNLCSGAVTFTTGGVFTGSLTSNASWTGGSITITGNAGGPGGAFTFVGSFSSATWTMYPTGPNSAYWVFVGTIASGTLTDSLGTFAAMPGAKVSLTQITSLPTSGVWIVGSGNTVVNLVPELGTLTLLGSGLVGLGVFARRRLSKKAPAAD